MNIKWVLSQQCSGCDRCGARGKADVYGLGEGVYPFDKFPKLPAHWGCDCTISAS